RFSRDWSSDVCSSDLHHVQVARRTAVDTRLAFTAQPDAITGIDTSRHLDRQSLVLFDPALAVTIPAGITDHLTGAMTTATGLLHRGETPLHAHLAVPTA